MCEELITMNLKIPFFRNRINKRSNSTFTLGAYVDHSGAGAATIGLRRAVDASSFAAVDLIASAFANLSVGVYDRNTRQKIEGSISGLLRKPNLDDLRFNFWYMLATDYFNDGNAYIYVCRNSDGDAVALYRLEPWAVSVYKNSMGRKVFLYAGNEYSSDSVIQIAARYGYDGLRGYSIYNEAYKVFGLSADMNSYTHNLYNNGIGKRTVIDISKAFPNATDEQLKQLREKYQNEYAGLENVSKPIVKTNGIEFSALDSGTPEARNQQLAENRKFQEEEVLKIFGIPEEMFSTSGNIDIEGVYTQFCTRAVEPLATAFQEGLENLLSISEQNIYIEYSYNSLVKTSLINRITAYVQQINNGLLSPNEARQKDNNTPYDGGDTHFVQASLMPLNPETIDSYMAGAKQKIYDLQQQQQKQQGTNDAPGIGDDKK
jgi:HK97 family phage portal protein